MTEGLWKGTAQWFCAWCDLPPWTDKAEYDAHMLTHWKQDPVTGTLTVAEVDLKTGTVTFKS